MSDNKPSISDPAHRVDALIAAFQAVANAPDEYAPQNISGLVGIAREVYAGIAGNDEAVEVLPGDINRVKNAFLIAGAQLVIIPNGGSLAKAIVSMGQEVYEKACATGLIHVHTFGEAAPR